jgi:hypothetical protein
MFEFLPIPASNKNATTQDWGDGDCRGSTQLSPYQYNELLIRCPKKVLVAAVNGANRANILGRTIIGRSASHSRGVLAMPWW